MILPIQTISGLCGSYKTGMNGFDRRGLYRDAIGAALDSGSIPGISTLPKNISRRTFTGGIDFRSV